MYGVAVSDLMPISQVIRGNTRNYINRTMSYGYNLVHESTIIFLL